MKRKIYKKRESNRIPLEMLKWTPQAQDCYNRGCICQGCIINDVVETKCHLKNIIPKILEQCGVPEETKFDFQTQYDEFKDEYQIEENAL